MININISQEKKQIETLLANNKVYDTLSRMRPIVAQVNNWDISDAFAKCETSVDYMLNYFSKGVKDPSQADIYNEIKERLYSLIDQIAYTINVEECPATFYSVSRTMSRRAYSLEQEISKYLMVLKGVEDAQGRNNVNELKTLETMEIDAFNYVWTERSLTMADCEYLKQTFEKEDAPTHYKALIVSALFLGLCEYFDKNRINLLISCYMKNTKEVSIIALLCLVLIIVRYRNRIECNQSVMNGISSLSDLPGFENDLMIVLLQIINTQDTDRISKKVHENLMPKIMKIYPNIMDKLKRTSETFDVSEFESNPKWENLVKDDKFISKIEEINKIQSEGGDVFISSFSHLKSFSFFNTISNWFLPFHKNASIVCDNLDSTSRDSVLSKIQFLCDSDKYSFVLSLGSIPFSQRNMLLSQLAAQSEELKELKQTELNYGWENKEFIVNKYLQNIYRFFTLYSRKVEFYNPFSLDVEYFSVPVFKRFFSKDKIVSIGEFYLKREMYSAAANCFESIFDDSKEDVSPLLYQKSGFCYQHLNMLDKAIASYKKYELFNEHDMWNVKHLASCYRLTGNIEMAIKYYRIAYEMSPENVAICINLGNALLENNEIDEAMKCYYKADYLDSSSHKALRPLAWCQFLKNEYTQSAKSYQKILELKPTAQDYINYGHLLFVRGETTNAIEMYKKSIDASDEGARYFIETMENDAKYLEAKGVGQIDIDLMLDAIKMGQKRSL